MSDIVERLTANLDKYPGFQNINTEAAADAPKRKYTVADIKRPQIMRMARGAYWYIRCGDYDWTGFGWHRQPEGSSGYSKLEADVLYAGLVATSNVPEVGE